MDVHIIDDDRSILLIHSKIAVNCGLSCASFSGPKDYLDKMTHPNYQPPFVILTDVEMPDINGYELISEIRKVYPHQRFIVATSSPDRQGCSTSACLYYQKPISKEGMEAAFKAILKCVKCGCHAECVQRKSCAPDDRTRFSVEGWMCPYQLPESS